MWWDSFAVPETNLKAKYRTSQLSVFKVHCDSADKTTGDINHACKLGVSDSFSVKYFTQF